MKRNQGFTLIELLAVIIILAVIALIATPIVLNVVDKAKESTRQSSVAGYADAAKLYVYDYMFEKSGQTPTNEDIKTNTTNQGETVVCGKDGEEPGTYYSKEYGIVLHGCTVGKDDTLYYFASGKTYIDANDATYKAIYDSIKGGSTEQSIISNISDECAKKGNTCTIDQIKTGVSMDIQVSPTETHKFYILSDDGTNVTLLMDSNLDLDGNGESNDTIKWQNIGSNVDGPITILDALELKTNTWINIQSKSYSLAGTNTDDYNGCTDYNVCISNVYTIASRTGKARLPRIQELVEIGCKYKELGCPSWSYNSIYWTSSANINNSSYAWFVNSNYGSIDDSSVLNSFGVRPVITISKSNIK